jgi:hypothetical protein
VERVGDEAPDSALDSSFAEHLRKGETKARALHSVSHGDSHLGEGRVCQAHEPRDTNDLALPTVGPCRECYDRDMIVSVDLGEVTPHLRCERGDVTHETVVARLR